MKHWFSQTLSSDTLRELAGMWYLFAAAPVAVMAAGAAINAAGIYSFTIVDTAMRNAMQRMIMCGQRFDPLSKQRDGYLVSWSPFFLAHVDRFTRTTSLCSTYETYQQIEAAAQVNGAVIGNLESTERQDTVVSLQIDYADAKFFYPWHIKRVKIDLEPSKRQSDAIDLIVATVAVKNVCVCYIHGPGGTGKSTVGWLLAQRMDAVFCNKWSPIQPGHELAAIMDFARPGQFTVVQIDETDIVLDRVAEGVELPARQTRIQVTDKITWNVFLDDVQLGMYPRLVLIMTSNKPRAACGDTFLRDGRVDHDIEFPDK
jgi:hypothetical protein